MLAGTSAVDQRFSSFSFCLIDKTDSDEGKRGTRQGKIVFLIIEQRNKKIEFQQTKETENNIK